MARQIKDHSFFAGKTVGAEGPKGCHEKKFEPAMGGGNLTEYFDTSEKVKEKQNYNVKKMNSQREHPMKG